MRSAAATTAMSFLVACGGVAPPASSPGDHFKASSVRASSRSFSFKTLNNPKDPNFNELLGINGLGQISGFYGTGYDASPSHGYVLLRKKRYVREKYPGSSGTVPVGGGRRYSAGFWVDAKSGLTRGYLRAGRQFSSYAHRQALVTELLGLNGSFAVGFYTGNLGRNHGFLLNEQTRNVVELAPPGAASSVAAGINGKGDIVGFLTTQSGATLGYFLKAGTYKEFSFPNAVATEALGINWQEDIVGSYVDAMGDTHGFMVVDLLDHPQWASIDDPEAAGSSVVNGINVHQHLVGYYVDSSGRVNGMLAVPASP